MRKICRMLCCLGAVLMIAVLVPGNVYAEDEFTCGAWINDSVTPECRTPMCDGTRLGLYITYKRHKNCTYKNTGYTFTIPDTSVESRGCC